ncbi:MAG: hypothetical protein JSS82_16680 [Bacteroidetes bacterium]|nr:hypothetical protein [Bacteroidota bacterium]
MRKFFFTAALALSPMFSFAQTGPALLEGEQPNDNSPICTEPIPLTKDWDDFKGGFKNGTHIPDFSFYTVDGKEVTLSKVLRETGKPVLLVAGNFSCPVYRRNAREIDSITNFYKDKLNVYVVYTVEAHPVGGTEAYPTIPVAEEQNRKDHIQIKQAESYLDRRLSATRMRKRMGIATTIVLDGPGNEWWSHAGYAPNNAYLINAKGVIVAKDGWFDSSMWCSIDRLLHTQSGHCQNKPLAQQAKKDRKPKP